MQLETERGCVGDQPQCVVRLKRSDFMGVLRLGYATAALRRFQADGTELDEIQSGLELSLLFRHE